MKTPVIMTIILALALNACKETGKQQQTDETKATKAYIPVADYIKGEIQAVAGLPVGILKRDHYGNRSDSAFIKTEEFNQLAAAFLPPELDKERFERSFTESSFMDQTTESLTFTYESTDSTSTVRRVDVLIAPSLQVDKIKSIYIEKKFSAGDTAVEQKMFWKASQYFQVITAKSLPGQSPDIRQVKVIWDPLHY